MAWFMVYVGNFNGIKLSMVMMMLVLYVQMKNVVISFVIVTLYSLVVRGAVFMMSPQSVNATLNSTIIFTCQGSVFSGFLWRINNTLVSSSSEGEGTATLEVFCSEDRDMSTVECIARFPNRTTIFSDPALLQLQGLLGPVTNLSVNSTTTSITLSWIPPFSLDITGVEPDFTHTVKVYNITSGERQSIGVYENITDSTSTFTLCKDEHQENVSSTCICMVNQTNAGGISMVNQTNNLSCEDTSLMNPDPSNLFEFMVIAINSVGHGDPSEPIQGKFSEMSVSVNMESPTTVGTPTSNSDDTTAEDRTTESTVTSTNTEATKQTTTDIHVATSHNIPAQPVAEVIIPIVVLITVIVLLTGAGIAVISVCLVRRHKRVKIEVSTHERTQNSYYEELFLHALNSHSSSNNGAPAVNQCSLNDEVTTEQGTAMYMTSQELDLKSTTQHPGPSDATVVYSEVPKHLNTKNLIYEHVDVKPVSKIQTVDDQFIVVYSDIKTIAEQTTDLHTVEQCESNHQPCVQNTLSDESSPSPQPFTRDNLLTALSPVAHKWKELGLQLGHGIDEDRIDEFDTNNETDESCLEEMMDYYLKNVHFQHTWEEIGQALTKIGEEGLAEKIN